MHCQDAKSLVPSYLDGELSESQAAPLRQHLLDCADCRASAQAGKSLSGWFTPDRVAEAGTLVPVGFASRVARRAFAGDTGQSFGSLASEAGAGSTGGAPGSIGRLLPFVLRATAVAAAVLLALSFALRSDQQPVIGDLRADDASYDRAIEALEALNAGSAADLTDEEDSTVPAEDESE